MFVREADLSYDLGPASARPYVDLAVLERALLDTGADAVWPGWGFVAEDPAFVDLCDKHGDHQHGTGDGPPRTRTPAVGPLPDHPSARSRPAPSRLGEGVSVLEPLFEFSGACAGCGETPYLKLVTQLIGDRMIVANATGCSSIYGGNLPTTPWTKNEDGRGPAWTNSLFEDNAEFGLGMRLGVERQAATRPAALESCSPWSSASSTWRSPPARHHRRAAAWWSIAPAWPARGEAIAATRRPEGDACSPRRGGDALVRRPRSGSSAATAGPTTSASAASTTCCPSGRNVNVLVLDTEVYSNTGGQASKATPRGAVAKFAAAGKAAGKKDLGAHRPGVRQRLRRADRDGRQRAQTVRGDPRGGGVAGAVADHRLQHMHRPRHRHVEVDGTPEGRRSTSGYWPLYRFTAQRAVAGAHPFSLDSKPPTVVARELHERRRPGTASSTARPRRSRSELLELSQADIDERLAILRAARRGREPRPSRTGRCREASRSHEGRAVTNLHTLPRPRLRTRSS